MRSIKRKLILSTLIITLASAIVFSTARVSAQNPQGIYSSIVQKLAEKFGLKESDVKAVFDEARQERQSQMQAKFETQLTQDVKDGKITEAQKQLILAKHQELQASRQTNFQNWQNLTPDQRKTAIQAQKQTLDDWAKQNGIDPQYLFGGFGRKAGHWKER